MKRLPDKRDLTGRGFRGNQSMGCASAKHRALLVLTPQL